MTPEIGVKLVSFKVRPPISCKGLSLGVCFGVGEPAGLVGVGFISVLLLYEP